MTKNQYYKVSENFYKYVNKPCLFELYWPSIGRFLNERGILLGVGAGANQGCLIIASSGYTYAIFYEHILKFI